MSKNSAPVRAHVDPRSAACGACHLQPSTDCGEGPLEYLGHGVLLSRHCLPSIPGVPESTHRRIEEGLHVSPALLDDVFQATRQLFDPGSLAFA
jgi:hypothetical protein